jgi:1-acyl-sn-glycerol-3-phosphate acyltransferase
LYVSNHVSWVDALIIQAVQPSVFVAKDEVRGWPVVGAIASKCGVIFVKRSSITSTRQMVNEVVHALSNGFCVAGFPEGTTSIGSEVNPFYSNLFEASILADAQVLPIALRYTRAASNGIVATVLTGQPISPIGHTRKTLAQLSQHAVSTQLATLNSQ